MHFLIHLFSFVNYQLVMEQIAKFSRRLRAIDHLPVSPLRALEEVWKEEDLHHFIHSEITIWFYMALSNDGAIYVDDDGESRTELINFFADLLPLIEACYCTNRMSLYYSKHHVYPDAKQLTLTIREDSDDDKSCTYLDEDEMVDPRQVMVKFCIKYSIEYARRELWDFLQAAECYTGPFRSQVSKFFFSEYYLKLLTMVEASYCLARQGRNAD
jgi:hypothetical protein